MRLPPQYAPVKRPDLVRPHECVDVVNGSPEHLVGVRLLLTHGANYNDPTPWTLGSYQLMSRQR